MGQGIKVSFYLRSNYQNRVGQHAIMVRIGIDGKWKTIGSSGIQILKEEWDSRNRRVTGRTQHALEINQRLRLIECKLIDIASKQPISDNYLNMVKDIYLGKSKVVTSFLQYFDKFLEDLKEQIGKGKTRVTYQKYLVTRNHFSDFLVENQGRKDIATEELDLTMINDFDIYLRTKLSMKQNSANKTVQFLKTVVLSMVRCGAIERDPFINYRFHWKQVTRDFLSEEELKSIMEKKLENPALEAVRDIFIFSCFTGLAYIDTANLEATNIVTKNGERWIVISRHKTGVSCNIPLLEVPQKILQKYEGKGKKGRLLPILSNQKMNAHLKEIADICGIKKNLTCHVARHTFATLMLNFGVSMESVSKMLGHTNIKTTMIYARLSIERIGKEMNQISDKLNELESSWKDTRMP